MRCRGDGTRPQADHRQGGGHRRSSRRGAPGGEPRRRGPAGCARTATGRRPTRAGRAACRTSRRPGISASGAHATAPPSRGTSPKRPRRRRPAPTSPAPGRARRRPAGGSGRRRRWRRRRARRRRPAASERAPRSRRRRSRGGRPSSAPASAVASTGSARPAVSSLRSRSVGLDGEAGGDQRRAPAGVREVGVDEVARAAGDEVLRSPARRRRRTADVLGDRAVGEPPSEQADRPPRRGRRAAGARPGRAGGASAGAAVGRPGPRRREAGAEVAPGEQRDRDGDQRGARRRRAAAAATSARRRTAAPSGAQPIGDSHESVAVADVADGPQHERGAEHGAGEARGDAGVLGHLRGDGGEPANTSPTAANAAPSATEPATGRPRRAAPGGDERADDDVRRRRPRRAPRRAARAARPAAPARSSSRPLSSSARVWRPTHAARSSAPTTMSAERADLEGDLAADGVERRGGPVERDGRRRCPSDAAAAVVQVGLRSGTAP